MYFRRWKHVAHYKLLYVTELGQISQLLSCLFKTMIVLKVDNISQTRHLTQNDIWYKELKVKLPKREIIRTSIIFVDEVSLYIL